MFSVSSGRGARSGMRSTGCLRAARSRRSSDRRGQVEARPANGYFTKRLAEDWLRSVLEDARRGTLPIPIRSGATFADAAADFLRYTEHDRGCKPSTLRDYRSNLKAHLLPAFGDQALELPRTRRGASVRLRRRPLRPTRPPPPDTVFVAKGLQITSSPVSWRTSSRTSAASTVVRGVYVSVCGCQQASEEGAMPDLAANRVGGAEAKGGPSGPAEGSPEGATLTAATTTPPFERVRKRYWRASAPALRR
jgi:hypothetical protein